MSQDEETTPNSRSEFQLTCTTKSPDGKWQLVFPWDEPLDKWSEETRSWSDGSWFVSVSVVHYPQK